MSKNIIKDEMSTLLSVLAKARSDGYTMDYTVTEHGLSPVNGSKSYKPEEVKVENFYRFEGASDPSESSILYLIKTKDGNKGTVTDSYGAYADPLITAFMEQVQAIEKK